MFENLKALLIGTVLLFPLTLAAQDGSLHMAAGINDKAQVEVLLSGGIDVNQTIKGGTTALMVAAKLGHTEVVRTLLDAGARIDQANDSGNTALMMAVLSRKAGTVEILMQRSADPVLENREGLSASEIAKLMGYDEIDRIIEDNRVPKG